MEQRTVQMLESLDGLMDCATNALKSIDKNDLLLDCELVKKLMLLLRPFNDLTDFVSDAKNSVGSILLIKRRCVLLELIILLKLEISKRRLDSESEPSTSTG